jgi:hypothetical protein
VACASNTRAFAHDSKHLNHRNRRACNHRSKRRCNPRASRP